MEISDLHSWEVAADEARLIQEELRSQILLVDRLPAEVRYVAGVDNTYRKKDSRSTAYAAVVVLSFPALQVVETRYAARPVTFPYIPGLLVFREGPAVIAAARQLEIEPDVFFFDAHGYSHFRRAGAASHLGLVLNRPSIGCAKSRLTGTYEEPPREFGAWTPLVDSKTGGLTLDCCQAGSFMPEPTRLAHQLVNQFANKN